MPPRASRRTGRNTAGTTKPARKKKPGNLGLNTSEILGWLPVLIGVALGIAAPVLTSLLQPLAPWGTRAVFPFVQLTGLHEFGFSDELTRNLPQMLLYLQFPLEGLLTRSSLKRGLTLTSALSQILFLHAVGALVLWLVSMGAQG
jgi:hypothetical protein